MKTKILWMIAGGVCVGIMADAIGLKAFSGDWWEFVVATNLMLFCFERKN